MRRFLPELVALTILPYLIAQGRRTRRLALRLPEASGPAEGLAGAGHDAEPLSMLCIGESTVAGVGVSSYEQAIGSRFASALAERLKRPVRWRAFGKNGATVADALEQLLPCVPERHVDLVLLAFGVNDTTSFRSVSRWERDVSVLLDVVTRRCTPHQILMSGVPPMAALPVLPQPLRYVMGLKARSLDVSLHRIAAASDAILHVPLALDLRNAALLACDGYHPSAAGYSAWAELLAEAALARLPPSGSPTRLPKTGGMPVR
ncbi:SGNH/GDSL hydrolase family protein [Noviherbaspirillum sp. CPCC 100848]|uniref:SGNH/GDSL hydrolase family protein n=1 Tax=Noviherbaspirillum album TaxID=3080276 RepID=A0ABU6JBZ5_9BURK|nr:SGNH/GDSL hydrolase family protein [Noviherbaspirillum sp. CPCC 100848]MEC4720674.1 SGNH/GDSL hydrolase family protein [Noviherbaspirillum sp. CPCC 100848]